MGNLLVPLVVSYALSGVPPDRAGQDEELEVELVDITPHKVECCDGKGICWKVDSAEDCLRQIDPFYEEENEHSGQTSNDLPLLNEISILDGVVGCISELRASEDRNAQLVHLDACITTADGVINCDIAVLEDSPCHEAEVLEETTVEWTEGFPIAGLRDPPEPGRRFYVVIGEGVVVAAEKLEMEWCQ